MVAFFWFPLPIKYRILVAMKVETDIIPSESDTTTCDTNDNALSLVSDRRSCDTNNNVLSDFQN